MRRSLITLMAFALVACRPKEARAQEATPVPDPPPAAMPAEQAVPDTVSGPQRAAAAAARTRPALERDLKERGLKFGDPVFIRIFKEEHLLELWMRNRETRKYEMFRSWPVAAMSGELGPKQAEGDGQAPEGFYFVTPDRMKPDSAYHLAFNIGFPNAYDLAHGRTGTFLMIHGNAVSAGCFAMTDPKIEEIYTLCAAALEHGQPYFRVHAFPFRMTAERLASAVGKPWEDFWKNLKEGYDLFEAAKVPPEVAVEGGRYLFKAGK